MLIFIDESGDSGMDSHNELFVFALVRFDNKSDVQSVDETIKKLKQDLGLNDISYEFHFSSCPNPLKDRFFNAIAINPIMKNQCVINAIVVNKPLISNPNLRATPKKFYNYFLRKLLGKSWISDATIIIDGQGKPKMVSNLKNYLNTYLKNQVRELEMKDSHKDNLIQLADMVAGAIARAHTTKPNKNDKWQNMLNLSSQEIWKFPENI